MLETICALGLNKIVLWVLERNHPVVSRGAAAGVIQFMMGVREHSSDLEVRKRTSRLAACLLPAEVSAVISL